MAVSKELLEYQKVDAELRKIEQEIAGSDERKKYVQAKKFMETAAEKLEAMILPCKRGYVRLTWNKDSRYCVDGILCQTPEELFDLLLTDYQDFELLRRTKGRREVTEADEKAVEKLCQPYLDWRKGAL